MIYSLTQALAHDYSEEQASPRPLGRSRASKALRVILNDQTLEFKSIDDFSFAIEFRTSVPAARFDELLQRSPDELWREAESIKSVEKNLVDILEDALCDASACGPAIQGLGVKIFSKDHDWRRLMQALNELNQEFEGYTRLALIKHLQYLGARQEILRMIFTLKSKGIERETKQTLESTQELAAVETVLFDVSELSDCEPTEHPLQRLPQGEAVRIHALPRHPIEIRIAKYVFKLVNDDRRALYDRAGMRYPLSDGQHLVGRGSENDITLSSEFRNVSHRHLIAEPQDDHVILLADISSHGTFAPPLQVESSRV